MLMMELLYCTKLYYCYLIKISMWLFSSLLIAYKQQQSSPKSELLQENRHISLEIYNDHIQDILLSS